MPKYVAVAAATVFVSLLWFGSGKGIGHLSKLDQWTLAFLATTCVAYLGSTSWLRGGLELAKFAMLTSLYFAFSRLTERKNLPLWTWCISLATIVVSIIGICQYLNLAFLQWPTAGLPSATFSYRNLLAMYLIVAVPVGIVPFLMTRSALAEILTASSSAASVLLLIYTRTRGSWVGLASAIMLVGVCLILRRKHLHFLSSELHLMTRRKVLIATAAVACVTWGAQIQPAPEQLGRLARIPDQKSSVSEALLSIGHAQHSGRMSTWMNTIRMVLDYPLFGVGLMDWENEYPRYDRGEQIRPGRAFRRPHNDYLWFAAEYGIPQFLIYVAFLLSAALTMWRSGHRP